MHDKILKYQGKDTEALKYPRDYGWDRLFLHAHLRWRDPPISSALFHVQIKSDLIAKKLGCSPLP